MGAQLSGRVNVPLVPHAARPFTYPFQVWAERPFTERDEYGLMGQAIQGVELMYKQVRAQLEGRAFVAGTRELLRLLPSVGRLLSRGDCAPPEVHAPQPGLWEHEQRIR